MITLNYPQITANPWRSQCRCFYGELCGRNYSSSTFSGDKLARATSYWFWSNWTWIIGNPYTHVEWCSVSNPLQPCKEHGGGRDWTQRNWRNTCSSILGTSYESWERESKGSWFAWGFFRCQEPSWLGTYTWRAGTSLRSVVHFRGEAKCCEFFEDFLSRRRYPFQIETTTWCHEKFWRRFQAFWNSSFGKKIAYVTGSEKSLPPPKEQKGSEPPPKDVPGKVDPKIPEVAGPSEKTSTGSFLSQTFVVLKWWYHDPL